MKYKAIGKCHVCNSNMNVVKLQCEHCKTKVEGEFELSKFCQLPQEELEFLEIFIKCRGSIKDVEKELGISYPTVRTKLDNVIKMLGYEETNKSDNTETKQEILQMLDDGKITAKEATERLKQLK